MKVNVEIIQISSSARATALSTNKVDAVFWTRGQIDDEFIETSNGTANSATTATISFSATKTIKTDC